MGKFRITAFLVAFWAAMWLAVPAGAAGPTTERVSLSSTGQEGNGDSGFLDLSNDGRLVVFESFASNLVAADTNQDQDAFLRDRAAGTTGLLSLSTQGAQGDAYSGDPTISGNNRFVAFDSLADNLVRNDTNGAFDIFVRDLGAGTTRRVSLSSSGGEANRDSFAPAISDDGRYITFNSDAENLVPGDTNDTLDVYVRDTAAGTTTRVSVSSSGGNTNEYSFAVGYGGISAEGRYVIFESGADNLVPGDNNGRNDVFLRDLVAGTTSLVSVSSSGAQGDEDSYAATISGNGRIAAWTSNATNLAPGANANGRKADVFVRDLSTGTTRLVSATEEGRVGNHDSLNSKRLSDDGRYLEFRSAASNLVKSDTNHVPDVFVADLTTGSIVRVSVSSAGAQADGQSANAYGLSGDGRWAGFWSQADNLVSGDTNGVADVFVRGPLN